jgi:hypothetical protein
VKRYVFRSEWRLPAPAREVVAVLERLDDYPAWWREVREARRFDDDTVELTVRSALPYALVFVTRRSVHDPERGRLEAEMTGDLDGFSRWTVTPDGSGALAVFDEDVVVNKRLLRALEPVARPAFRANHWLMMRHGEAGLRARLTGG